MMTGEVVAFRLVERVRQDSEPIALMYRNMGTATAEQVVSRALGELSMTMVDLCQQVARHERADLPRQLRRPQRMAEQVGLVSLGRVAADIRLCTETGDATAFAAVRARLIRVAECSLLAEKGKLDQKP